MHRLDGRVLVAPAHPTVAAGKLQRPLPSAASWPGRVRGTRGQRAHQHLFRLPLGAFHTSHHSLSRGGR